MKKKIAFVAMKYDNSAWKDKRYQVIREGLEEAGFEVIRADEIKSSGPVVDEVCNYFKTADLVVIDSTGDSHSVSYEIGYCHGINRDTQSTILLKKQDDSQIPFNFRHFRHQYYKDLKHLRRLIREWFFISIPIHPDEHGFVFNFNVKDSSTSTYGLPCAEILIDFIKASKFSGRCEFYAGDSYVGYLKGIGLKYKNGKTPEHKFWLTAEAYINQNMKKYDPGITLEISEFASIREMKESFVPCGIVQFENGILQRILNPESSANDTWFIMALNERNPENVA